MYMCKRKLKRQPIYDRHGGGDVFGRKGTVFGKEGRFMRDSFSKRSDRIIPFGVGLKMRR